MNLFLFCTRDRKLLKFVNSVFLTKNVLIHMYIKFENLIHLHGQCIFFFVHFFYIKNLA